VEEIDLPPGDAPARPLRHGVQPATLVSVLLAAMAIAWLVFAPSRVYVCRAAGSKSVSCTISKRLLGMVPFGRPQQVDGIAAARFGTHEEQSEILNPSDPDPRRRRVEVSTTVQTLALADGTGTLLWEGSEQHLVGSSLHQVAEGIQALLDGPARPPLVRWNAAWPPLLLGSLFLIIATSQLGTVFGWWLLRRGIVPEALRGTLYWAPTLLMVAVMLVAVALALLGAHPPAWLAARLA